MQVDSCAQLLSVEWVMDFSPLTRDKGWFAHPFDMV